ncbi:MAG TPA: 2-amino-4-hydroxy-6-hydroxymethyldihydropteridine diphosphokinase [Dehalococcoidia bacterium]|nr:2-amino-4-hydroxy-6-hydroxymethyldihydropteridine diphosphokinase [Dehalococcoidia bacterium]
MSTVYIALGANLGNREANLRMALRAITRMARVQAISALYESEPEGGADQPAYYNAVCRIETGLEPLPLLRFLKGLEHEIGRRPTADPKGPRPIDLDILMFDDRQVDTEALVIPHPRMTSRPFVLTPLAEIAPDLSITGAGDTAAALAKKAGGAGLNRIAAAGWDGVAGAPQQMRL